MARFSDEDREHVFSGATGTHYFIERLEAATQPEIQLDQLAERSDPPGLLARRLLILDGPPDGPERRALLDAAREKLDAQAREKQWSALRVDALDDEIASGWLRRSGMRLLDKLLAQRENAQ